MISVTANYFRLLANLNKLNKSFDLIKADQPKVMPDEQAVAHLPAEQKKPLLDWARAKIPNTPARSWYLHHIGQNPKLHDDLKEEMEHHGSMMGRNKNINQIQFSKKLPLTDGIKQLQGADDKWQKDQSKGGGLIKPSKDTTKALDLGNGWGWYNLNTPQCDQESKVMGHCGTASSEAATLYSLRKEVKMGSQTFHQPHITAEVYPGGLLRQIKGKNNSKPDAKYHEAIMPFLMSEHVNHKLPSTYKPETDFQVEDLSKEHRAKLGMHKPALDPFNSRDPEHAENMIDSLKEAYRVEWGEPDLADITDEDSPDDIESDSAFEDDETIKKLRTHQHILRNHAGDIEHALIKDNPDQNDTRIISEIAKHPKLTPETIKKALDHYETHDRHGYIRRHLVKHPNVNGDVVKHVFSKERNYNDGTYENMLMSPNVDGETLEKIYFSPAKTAMRYATLQNSNHTKAMVDHAINDGKNESLVRAALQSDHFNDDHAEKILSNPNSDYSKRRYAVTATNATDKTFSKILSSLSEDDSSSNKGLTYHALEHPNISKELLLDLWNKAKTDKKLDLTLSQPNDRNFFGASQTLKQFLKQRLHHKGVEVFDPDDLPL